MSDNGGIILPTDFSEASMAAVPWAVRMGERLDLPLHCVTVVHQATVFAPAIFGDVAGFPPLQDLLRHAEAKMQEFVRRLSERTSQPLHSVVLSGNPAQELVEYSRKMNASMIVIATHGYSGVDHVLVGSTTERVVRLASCAVLTIRK